MSNNERCCGNCARKTKCRGNANAVDDNCCSRWQRDPRFWLTILPTEVGHYWWKKHKRDEAVIIEVYVRNADGKLYVSMLSGFGVQLSMVGGLWQGPIRPEGET
jgi:hypothetical protein